MIPLLVNVCAFICAWAAVIVISGWVFWAVGLGEQDRTLAVVAAVAVVSFAATLAGWAHERPAV